MANLGDISKIILPGDKEYNFKDAAMRSEIATARGTYASLGARLDDMSGGGSSGYSYVFDYRYDYTKDGYGNNTWTDTNTSSALYNNVFFLNTIIEIHVTGSFDARASQGDYAMRWIFDYHNDDIWGSPFEYVATKYNTTDGYGSTYSNPTPILFTGVENNGSGKLVLFPKLFSAKANDIIIINMFVTFNG